MEEVEDVVIEEAWKWLYKKRGSGYIRCVEVVIEEVEAVVTEEAWKWL